MRKLSNQIVAFSLLLSLTPLAGLAQSPTTTQDIKQKRDELKQEVRQKREQVKAEIKQRLEGRKKDRVKRLVEHSLRVFQNAIDREKNLADRIESRLNKFAQNGKDVSALRDKLTKARGAIDSAAAALAEVKSKAESMLNSDNPKDEFKAVKDLFKGVKDKIKEAHAALVDVINSIKGMSDSEKAAKEENKRGERTVEMTAGGFAPSVLKIKTGTKVTFINRDSQPHWPASGVHPTHQICPGFDALKGLNTGESYSFTFNEAKVCPMHDHLNPSLRGTITVEN